MIRLALRFLFPVLAVGLAVSASSLAASAQSRTGFFIEQLRSASDFRVRTQAALALGASEDPAALAPLCEGLNDASDSVRSAAAAAVGKLKNPAGAACLKRHLGESNGSVRAVIERSIKALEGGSKVPPPPGPNDTFYVAIGPVTDRTGRGDGSVQQLVTVAMQDKLLSLRGYAVAPAGEAPPVAKRVIKDHSLKGFFLQTRVEPPQSSGGDLTVVIRVTMWTYPAKSLQGEFAPKLTMSGAVPGDKESENNLIKIAVENAIDSFARIAASTN
jgi:hypothetical protein